MMSNYAKLKKLDEESLQKLQEGRGPADECLCPILAEPEEKKGFAASVKKAFKSIGKKKSGTIPFSFNNKENNKGGPSFILPSKFTRGHSSLQEVHRKTSCGKCGCDSEKFFLKHSYANIRITSPDISSICPCDSSCLPDKEKYKNNIEVIVENAQISNKENVK